MKGRKAIVRDIRRLYNDKTPLRAFRSCNRIPCSVDLFSVYFFLNRLEIGYIPFSILLTIHELNLSHIPARPSAFYTLMIKTQVANNFKILKERQWIEEEPFNQMLTHTVERATMCYKLTEQGKKIIASYNYLVKDTQKQAKNARLKYIDGN